MVSFGVGLCFLVPLYIVLVSAWFLHGNFAGIHLYKIENNNTFCVVCLSYHDKIKLESPQSKVEQCSPYLPWSQ